MIGVASNLVSFVSATGRSHGLETKLVAFIKHHICSTGTHSRSEEFSCKDLLPISWVYSCQQLLGYQ